MYNHHLSALSLAAVGIAAVAAQECEPWRNIALWPEYPEPDYVPLCLDPDEKVSVSPKLDKLFPEGLKLVYGLQSFSNDEILDLATDELILDEYDNLQNAGFWFEYSKSKLDPSAERSTQWDVYFMHELNGTIEGGNGGCDGVFGKTCADKIVTALKEQLWESADPSGRKPNNRVDLSMAYQSISMIEECPEAVNGASFPQPKVIAFESEDSDDESYIMPSGNVSWAYDTSKQTGYTLAEQRKRIAYAVIIQVPYVDELEHFEEAPKEKWWTTEDVEVRLACMRHDNSNSGDNSDKGSDGGGKDGSSDDDASSGDQGDSGKDDEEDFATVGTTVRFTSLVLGLAATVAINMV